MKAQPPIAIAVCALELELKPDASEIQLLPAGQFRAGDGRPKDVPHWYLDAALAQAIIDKLKSRKNALVIDYEHQTLYADQSGQPAPAAGWFRTLEWRAGQGLFALHVEWTARAKQLIEAREYRYLSPVITYHKKTGAVTALVMAALTNTPGIDGMVGLDARAAARFSFDQPDHSMNQEELRKALGLNDEATDDELKQAAAALLAKAEKLRVTETELAALKAAKPDAKPDPAQYVPVATVTQLQSQVAELTTKINKTEIDGLIEGALQAGKLLPPMEQWARELGAKDVALLRAHLDAAAPIAALTGTQTGGKAPAGKSKDGLSEDELAICKNMNIKPDDYQKSKQAEAA